MFFKFFTPSTSKNSYPKSNISAISAANYLVNSICGTIYHKSTSYIHSKITNNKSLDRHKQNETPPPESNQQNISQAPPELTTPVAAETPPEELTSNNETDKEDELQQLFQSSAATQFPKGYTKQFPEDYPNELHKFHQIIPEIKFLNPNKSLYKHFPHYYYNCSSGPRYEKLRKHHDSMRPFGESIIQEFKKPITSPSELISLTKKWLRFQEIWGENLNKIYYIATTTEKQHHPCNLYKTYQTSNYKQVIAISRNTDRLYHETLIRIFKEPESLKNLILILGLEYSFTHLIQGHNTHAYTGYYVPSRLNSVEHILHEQTVIPNKSFNISTTLLHLAVKQNILSKVSFLLTKDNVNCEGYDLYCNPNNGIYVIKSLDNPSKIAIDNFDSANIETLLVHGADLKMMVINDELNSRYYTPPYLPLSDYFMSKTPVSTEEITSYIAIALLLYNYLPPEERDAFTEKAKNKMITQKSDSIFSFLSRDKEESLSNLMALHHSQPLKSAYKVGLQDIKKEELEANDATDKNITNFENKARKMNHLAYTNYCVEQEAPSAPRIDITFAGDTDFSSTSGEQSEITKSSFCNLL